MSDFLEDSSPLRFPRETVTSSHVPLSLLGYLDAKANKVGADAADAVNLSAIGLSHAQRLGTPERLEREESHDVGLRVLLGKRQAIVSSTDLATDRLDELVERALAMARVGIGRAHV